MPFVTFPLLLLSSLTVTCIGYIYPTLFKTKSDSNTGSLRIMKRETVIDEYNPWNRISIIIGSFLLQKLSPNAHSNIKIGIRTSFQDFVYITKDLLMLPPQEIKRRVLNFLRSLVPPQVGSFFRKKYLENPRQICEQSAFFMSFGLLTWLVGPTESFQLQTIDPKTGAEATWLSGVKIKECRYLAESGCKAACLHICRDPTQTFFADDLGTLLLRVHIL